MDAGEKVNTADGDPATSLGLLFSLFLVRGREPEQPPRNDEAAAAALGSFHRARSLSAWIAALRRRNIGGRVARAVVALTERDKRGEG